MKKRTMFQAGLIVVTLISLVFFSDIFFHGVLKPFWNEVFNGFGLALIVLGFFLRIAGRGYKKDAGIRQEMPLMSGPYRVVRNPRYLGMIVIGIGVVLILFQWWVTFILLGVFLWTGAVQALKEDRELRNGFGLEYMEYSSRVHLFMPHRLGYAEIKDLLFIKRSWLKKDLSIFALTMLFVTIFEIWENTLAFGMDEFWKVPGGFFWITVVSIAGVVFCQVFFRLKDAFIREGFSGRMF